MGTLIADLSIVREAHDPHHRSQGPRRRAHLDHPLRKGRTKAQDMKMIEEYDLTD